MKGTKSMNPQMECRTEPQALPASETLLDLARSVNDMTAIVQDQAMKIFTPEIPKQTAQEPVEMNAVQSGVGENNTFTKEMHFLLKSIHRRTGEIAEILGGFIQ
jgi:hypothetical protein